MNGIQEVGPQSPVGVTPRHAAAPVPAVENIGDDQGHQGEGQEDQAGPEINQSHEYENDYRGQRRDDHLGQVAAEECLQPFHALSQRHQSIARTGLVEVTRSQVQGMLVEPLPQPHLHDAGGMVADHLLQVLQPRAGHNEGRHDCQRPSKGGERRPFLDYLDDNNGRNHQPGNPGSGRQHTHQGGQNDPPSDVLGQG